MAKRYERVMLIETIDKGGDYYFNVRVYWDTGVRSVCIANLRFQSFPFKAVERFDREFPHCPIHIINNRVWLIN